MSLVLDLANNFKINEFKDISNGHEVTKIKALPKLLWVVRDFSLKLVDVSQNEITMRQ